MAIFVCTNALDLFTRNCVISILTNNLVYFHSIMILSWYTGVYSYLMNGFPYPLCLNKGSDGVHKGFDKLIFLTVSWGDSLNEPSAGGVVLCREALGLRGWFSAIYNTFNLSFPVATWQQRFAQVFWNMLILLLASAAFGIFKNPTRLLKSFIFPEDLFITGGPVFL